MLQPLLAKFTEHPATVGESYWVHAWFAGKAGLRLIATGICCLVHALLPFLFVTTASDLIKEYYQRFIAPRNRHRAARQLMAEEEQSHTHSPQRLIEYHI